jgi:spermidine/putrescine transport system substrate-binding protein
MDIDHAIKHIRSGRATRREINQALAAVGLGTFTLGTFARPGQAQGDTPMYFTWGGNPYEEFFAGYAETYGAMPELSFFGDEDEAFAKMNGGFEPDVVDPCSYEIRRWYDAGLIADIETDRLTNYPDIIPSLKTVKDAQIDGKTMWVATDWGVTSIVYRADLAPEYVDNESWSILWDKKYAGKLSNDNSVIDGFTTGAMYLGLDPFNLTQDEIAQVRDALVAQRELLLYYGPSRTDFSQAMASGELVAGTGWSSVVLELQEQGLDVRMMNPKEGVMTWVCGICRHASNAGRGEEMVEKAHALIDAVISPEVGYYYIIENGSGYSNMKSFEMVSDEELAERSLPRNPEEMLSRGIFQNAMANMAEITTMWEEIKAGF